MDLMSLTAVELGRMINAREVSAVEAVDAALAAIEKKETEIHGFVTVDAQGARKQAQTVQKMLDEGVRLGALAGVPVAIKDNLCTKNLRTTCSSKMLSDFIPTYTAQAVTKLQEAGAIIIGKTNLDEFAMGGTTETSYYGTTRNPWNPAHVPGGSSGGSAAAVAAEECSYALGTDTGGSIRQPSAFCGVTGMKPTYGTVSRYGMIAYGSSLDQIGPIAKDVTDCAAILEAITSYDRKDATSVCREGGSILESRQYPQLTWGKDMAMDSRFTDALTDDVRGMRIGIPREYFGTEVDAEVREAVLHAAKILEEKGAVTEEFSLPMTEYTAMVYSVIACAEASSNLARFDGVKYGYRAGEYANLHEMYKKSRTEGFGAGVKRRILFGTLVLSSGYYEDYYLQALRARTLIKQEFDRAFQKYDVILCPSAATTAPKIAADSHAGTPSHVGDIHTVSVNLAGLPAISLPCGKDKNGLPIGLQLIGDCFQEKKILRGAYAFEQTRGYEHSPFAGK